MNNRKSGPLILGAVGMILLILDGKTAVSGMQAGILLCLHTLIPSLFPFFVLSTLVTGSMIGRSFGPIRRICSLCRMPVGSESLLLVGLLGGYPIGAGNIGAERKRGNLSREDAQRLAIFCNNPGPSFLFGILGPLFSDKLFVWILWCIQIAASLTTGFLLPGGSAEQIKLSPSASVSLSDSLNRSVKNMALVCGWVLLFRVVLSFLESYVMGYLPTIIQTLLTGLLELSNGCLALSKLDDERWRFFLGTVMLSLGGICVVMQTQAVFPELKLWRYITGRILHCLICCLLSLLFLTLYSHRRIMNMLPILLFILISIISLLLILHKQKKEVAICRFVMYNKL